VIASQVQRIASTAAPAFGVLNEVSCMALAWLRQAGCGLTGHEMIRRFEPQRMSLECLSCGLETPGWTLHETPAATAGRAPFALARKMAERAIA
jgi:hypothetical protein